MASSAFPASITRLARFTQFLADRKQDQQFVLDYAHGPKFMRGRSARVTNNREPRIAPTSG
jgi:hypothetical protein